MKKTLSILLIVSIMLMSISSFATAHQVPEGFEKSSIEFASGIKTGWNLGNALDSYDANHYLGANPSPAQMETYWYNPITTKAMFEKVKEAGFNAVRIPVTWLNFTGEAPDYIIDEDWMNRVQQVVDYAMDLDLYVIINVHHDDEIEHNIGWLLPVTENKEEALNRFEKIWIQIASRFKDYPSKLIFEGMNELFLPDVSAETSFAGTAESRTVINELNQKFVDTVRATGGNNQYRYLMCPTHAAAAVEEAFLGFELPKDDRIMLSVHIYDDKMYYLKEKLVRLKNKFIDKGVPVIIGEWGTPSSKPLAERIVHAEEYITLANQYGVKAFVWDDGGSFALFNRNTLMWRFPEIKDSILNALDNPKYVLKWKETLNANWGGSPTYHQDGSMNVKWNGIASNGGKQNQYASNYYYGGDFANATIAKAKSEGKTIEFTVKVISAKDKGGTNLSSVQFTAYGPITTGTAVWMNVGSSKTFKIDASSIHINNESIIQLIVQNYSVTAMYDVEIEISPIKISE